MALYKGFLSLENKKYRRNKMKPITKEGLEKLKKNIKALKELRLDFLKKKEDSFTQGSDLSENAEYIFATEEMYKIDKKINEVEQDIMKSKIIDYSTFPADSVKFGLTVTLVSDEQEDRIFQIVGSSETDIENNKLSVESPLGISLLGKVVGDEVYIGDHLYEISKIENI